jgi:hypothetical protein
MSQNTHTDDDDLFRDILSRATAGRRSTLYQWMFSNHDRFAATLSAAGKPNWSELAKKFGEMGLRDRLGKPPSASNSRLTWVWVRKAHAKAQGQLTKSPASPIRPGRPDPNDDFNLPDVGRRK